jgi:hypothetical protein
VGSSIRVGVVATAVVVAALSWRPAALQAELKQGGSKHSERIQ